MNGISCRVSLLKRLQSFVYAAKGIGFVLRTQPNFLIHLVILFFVILAGWLTGLSTGEWIWITIVSGMVLTAELFNTALEEFTDLVSPQFNKKAGRVKDLAAGAVLISAMTAAIVGLVIFAPKLL